MSRAVPATGTAGPDGQARPYSVRGTSRADRSTLRRLPEGLNSGFEGTLVGTNGKPVWIDGLWGLQFGNGVAGTPMTLLFTAGPDGEQHGLLGSLTLAPDLDD